LSTHAQGWPGVARLVLPAAAADAGSVAEAVLRLEALTPGVPLLLLAVRSRSAALVRAPLAPALHPTHFGSLLNIPGGPQLKPASPAPCHAMSACSNRPLPWVSRLGFWRSTVSVAAGACWRA
jgi:hypothetical protein